jgi:membrane protease subunit HflC
VLAQIRKQFDREARQYGVQVIDVRIKRADLPEGTALERAFANMEAAREQEATAIRADGQKQAQIIEADAEAQRRADLCRLLQQGSLLLRFLPRHEEL